MRYFYMHVNEFHECDDEWESNAVQHKLCGFIYKKQVTLVFGVKSLVDVYLWCRIVTGREHEGTFWNAGDIPFLDLGISYTGVHHRKFIKLHIPISLCMLYININF